MKRLIFGCGYLGSRVARRWIDSDGDVFAVTRSASRAAELEQMGLHPIVADVTDSATLAPLPPVETVLYAIGYDRRGSKSMEEVYAGGVRHVLAALPVTVRRFIYISTTGVYGGGQGEWLNEQTPPQPEREGGIASLAAERVLAGSPFASRAVVLRMAGLYGPGRIPFLEKLKAGEPIPAAHTGWLNLIHVDDAAAVVLAAERGLPEVAAQGPTVLNVSDGHPVQRGDYYRDVARLIGAPPPRFQSPDPNSPRAARASTSRRISNAALLRELKLQLAYPDYRAGLEAIFANSASD